MRPRFPPALSSEMAGPETKSGWFEKGEGDNKQKVVRSLFHKRANPEDPDDPREVESPVEATPETIAKERIRRERFQKNFLQISIDALSRGVVDRKQDKRDAKLLRLYQTRAQEVQENDYFDGFYGNFGVLIPPLDPMAMVRLTQKASIFSPIIDSMRANVGSFGQIFVQNLDFTYDRDLQTVKQHIKGKLMHRLESDGVKHLEQVYQEVVPAGVTLEKEAGDDDYRALMKKAIRALPIIAKAVKPDTSMKNLAKLAWPTHLKKFLQGDGRDDFEKIRTRTYSTQIKRMEEEKADELTFLESWFTNCNPKMSFTRIRGRGIVDRASLGGYVMELVRDPLTRIPLYAGHVEFSQIRLTHPEAPVLSRRPLRINALEIAEAPIPIRYRRFAQTLGQSGRFIWFKDFGDERIMDLHTGRFVGCYVWNALAEIYEAQYWGYKSPEEFYEKNPDFIEANELLFDDRYNPTGCPYPVPPWIGCLDVTQGFIAMEAVNAGWFNNNMIPPLVVKVNNGTLSGRSYGQLTNLWEEKRGVEQFYSPLILEAATKDQARNFNNSQVPSIEIEPLASIIQQDATHQKYDEGCRLKIRSSFRLPPSHVGQEAGYTKQSVEASKTAAEEQVFQPERKEFDDFINTLLMPALRINHWRMMSNNPPVADSLRLAQVLATLGKAGFITVGEVRQEVATILNRPVRGFDENLTQTPFPLVLLETKAQQNSEFSNENYEDKMGARPDKDGFITDSAVLKSVGEEVGVRLRLLQLAKNELEGIGNVKRIVDEVGYCLYQRDDEVHFYTKSESPSGTGLRLVFEKKLKRAA